MKMDQVDFHELVDQAMTQSGGAQLRPVIEKELLHYDILYCLEKEGLLDNLVFQGGTSLRLCYGGSRLSEDLDFAGGADFSARQMSEMKECLSDYIGRRYGLESYIKEPASLKDEDPNYAELNIDKWQIGVVTSPERSDIPRQRIKIEVANVPAYTSNPLPIRKNYDFLPDGYERTVIYVESLDEIMADKLIALPATQRYVRYRDLWDLAWLSRQGASVDAHLVARKADDYRLPDYVDRLGERIDSLPEICQSPTFRSEMQRFIPAEAYESTLGKDKYLMYLENTNRDLLTGLYAELSSAPGMSP